jgi:hypothetical protein
MSVASGTYTFTFINDRGIYTEVEARYSFVIVGNKIINHHSSLVPAEN